MPLKSVTLEKLERMQKEVSIKILSTCRVVWKLLIFVQCLMVFNLGTRTVETSRVQNWVRRHWYCDFTIIEVSQFQLCHMYITIITMYPLNCMHSVPHWLTIPYSAWNERSVYECTVIEHSPIPRPLPDFISQLKNQEKTCMGSKLRHGPEMVDSVCTGSKLRHGPEMVDWLVQTESTISGLWHSFDPMQAFSRFFSTGAR